jgi:hypothetical protein
VGTFRYLNGIHSNGNLMANYAIKYFNDIFEHADQVSVLSGILALPTVSSSVVDPGVKQ